MPIPKLNPNGVLPPHDGDPTNQAGADFLILAADDHKRDTKARTFCKELRGRQK